MNILWPTAKCGLKKKRQIICTVKANPQRTKANAKAKKIKGQSEKNKEWAAKHQTIFSLSLGVGRPLIIILL